MLGRFRGGTSGLLLAQLAIDLLFIASTFSILTPGDDAGHVSLSDPRRAWLVSAQSHRAGRTRHGINRAVAGGMLLRTGSVQAITQAALVGAGYFLLALLGMLLGRSAEESEHRAALRTADVRRLAHINQVVINELEDGVLVVGALARS